MNTTICNLYVWIPNNRVQSYLGYGECTGVHYIILGGTVMNTNFHMFANCNIS